LNAPNWRESERRICGRGNPALRLEQLAKLRDIHNNGLVGSPRVAESKTFFRSPMRARYWVVFFAPSTASSARGARASAAAKSRRPRSSKTDSISAYRFRMAWIRSRGDSSPDSNSPHTGRESQKCPRTVLPKPRFRFTYFLTRTKRRMLPSCAKTLPTIAPIQQIQYFACDPLQTGPPNAPVAPTAIPRSLVAVTRDIPLMNQRRPLDHGGSPCDKAITAITHMMVI
jgi:hypothetical protein